jgi:hypothetical protein
LERENIAFAKGEEDTRGEVHLENVQLLGELREDEDLVLSSEEGVEESVEKQHLVDQML